MEYNNAQEQKIIHTHSVFGFGDNLICFIFFSQIKKYIEENNIHIKFYCSEKHHKCLHEFNSSNNIHILPYLNHGYHLWQVTEDLYSGKYIEDILCDMFNKFLKSNDIPITVDLFEYKDEDLLIPTFNTDYNNIDTLIINSTPTSGQFEHNKQELNEFIIKLSKTRKVAVTEYLNDSILSLHDKTIRTIATVAKKVKTIIAINTGPSLGLYNSEILDNVENVYLLDTTNHYKFKTRKFTKIKKISDLNFLILINKK